MVASTLYGGLRTGDLSATIGCTPHILHITGCEFCQSAEPIEVCGENACICDGYTSGAPGQNSRCSCAFYPTHWHGVPRIFLATPLSYAAEMYALPKPSSFRATENSQPVHFNKHWI